MCEWCKTRSVAYRELVDKKPSRNSLLDRQQRQRTTATTQRPFKNVFLFKPNLFLGLADQINETERTRPHPIREEETMYCVFLVNIGENHTGTTMLTQSAAVS